MTRRGRTNISVRVVVGLESETQAGQEDYEALRPLSYKGADVFLVCFSIDRPEALENVKDIWIPEIQSHVTDVPWVLVATKGDLREDNQTDRSHNRQLVELAEAEAVGKELGAAGYVNAVIFSVTSILIVCNVQTFIQSPNKIRCTNHYSANYELSLSF